MAKSLLLIINILFVCISLNPFQTKAQNTTTTTKLTKAEFIIQVLEGHNVARKAVGVAPLQWNELLSTYARIYSSHQRRKDCKLIHSDGKFGENLFWGQGKQWLPKDAVAAWVDEKKWYDYETNSCNGPQCGHYTQVVWRETKFVGCSKIICNSGDTFITCEYYPAGNYEGERPY